VYESDATDDGLTNRVRACLKKLPETQREVLLLSAWEGLKPRQIAKVTGSRLKP
jgi:DNA-directed RNA polymerase specialized sigma24 family protein